MAGLQADMAAIQADITRALDGYQIVADETSGALKNAGGSLPLNSLCLKVLARLIEAAIEASKKQGGERMTPEEFSKAPLSAVIRVALDDLARVESDPRYKVNMTQWHRPIAGVCHVCLAGAIMAETLGVPPEAFIGAPDLSTWLYKMSDDVSGGARARLMALDLVMRGYTDDALIWVVVTPPKGVEWPPVTPYADDPAAFRRDLLAVAAALEERGL